MTNPPSPQFTVAVDLAPPALTVRVVGELDYDTSGELLDIVLPHLSQGAVLREVRLDFGELAWIDSSGLSALLMIHRHTSAAGMALHLDNRPEFLERTLHLTNVLEYLTGPAASARGDEQSGDVTEAGAT
ncbi:STAS domain-containing protein [Streptomyces sp. NPDC058735]|uniref:STAS domain-containing protein n=1 Tax=unclassified Streptomyces TaxID=2593676 RepID=UPI00367DD6B4